MGGYAGDGGGEGGDVGPPFGKVTPRRDPVKALVAGVIAGLLAAISGLFAVILAGVMIFGDLDVAGPGFVKLGSYILASLVFGMATLAARNPEAFFLKLRVVLQAFDVRRYFSRNRGKAKTKNIDPF